MGIGEKIQYLRKEKKFSQEALAEKMDIDLTKYKSIEKIIKDIKNYIISNGGECN